MISKDMYKILKAIPHYPERIALQELSNHVKITSSKISTLINVGLSNNLIRYAVRHPYNNLEQHPISLTEEGQLEIEEYRRTSNSSAKATWAIIISAISAVIAVVGWFFPLA